MYTMEKTSKEKEETTEKMIHKGEIIISPLFFYVPVSGGGGDYIPFS